MKNTIVTGSLIVFSDGFVWKRLSNEKAYKIWVLAENEDFELYKVRVDDESESLIESLEDLQDAFKQGHYVCIEVGKLPYSIDLNYLRNLQELSVEAVDYLSGLKECSREESFNIIQEWAKEFTEKYENYDFNGSYYTVYVLVKVGIWQHVSYGNVSIYLDCKMCAIGEKCSVNTEIVDTHL